MSGTQVFVIVFAVVSTIVSLSAIWRVANADGLRYRWLWIAGSLFGFMGFATTFDPPGDLYLQFGIQVPVLLIWGVGGGTIVLKALFPIVAAIALVRLHSFTGRPDR